MFAKSTHVDSAYRVVAILVASAILLWSLGAWSQAEAANVLGFKDTLSDSAPGVASDHEFEFAVVDSVDNTETIVLTFPEAPSDVFNFGSVAQADIQILENGVDDGMGTDWSAAVSYPTITITSTGGDIAAGATTTIRIGTNAGGTNQIINPATSNTSYEIQVTAGNEDTGATRVAIVDTVQVTAAVLTTFDFTVSGLATSTTVNGTSTTGTTDSTSIPFGVVNAGEIKTLAQELNVSTNARNGFVVTVEQDQNLLSSTGADIDGFIDGAYTNTPAAWQSPANTILQEETYGHWGLTSDDDLNSDEFGSNLWVAASTTPREVFTHDGPSDGTTANIGSTTVGYQVEISPLQEAGDDYTTTLTYIATPTF